MFISERHRNILDKIQLEGKVKVKELSELYHVSEDCIRKDLKILENENKLKRAYGGAIKLEQEAHVYRDVFERRNLDIPTKQTIAQKAYDEIKDGDTMFLDVSTTNILLAKLLANGEKQCIVVSNMIDILQILGTNKNITVIGTGGEVNKELNGFVGSMTYDIINKYHFDKSFVGTTGIDFKSNYTTTFDLNDGMIKEAIVNNTKTVYLIMEVGKFGVIGTYKCFTLDKIDYIITNELPEKSVLNQLNELEIEVK